MAEAISFHSEGFKLMGDVYLPDGLEPGNAAPPSCSATAIPASRTSTCLITPGS